jgi:hypothetical protein
MAIFKREITFDVEEGEEGTLAISGTLKDTRLDKPLHEIKVRAEMDLEDGRINLLEGEMPRIPREDCRYALYTLSDLVGEKIEPGFTQLVRDVVGSSRGCSHLAVLVTNLGHMSVQGRGALTVARWGEGEEAMRLMRRQAVQLGIIGNCYSWREDGPLMKRMRAEIEGNGEE